MMEAQKAIGRLNVGGPFPREAREAWAAKRRIEHRTNLFSDTVEPILDKLQRLASTIARGSSDADDLLQEALLVSFMKFETFAPDSNFCAWVGQTMRFIHANQQRRENTCARALHKLSREYLISGGDSLHEMETDQILSALDSVYRIPVLLADFHGFTYREIADLLDVPLGTVMSRLYRGRRSVQRLARLAPLTQIAGQIMARFPCVPSQVRWSAVVFNWRAGKAIVAAERTSLRDLPRRGDLLPLSEFSRREVLRRGPVRTVPDLTIARLHRPRVWSVLLQAGIRSFSSAPIFLEGALSGELNVSSSIQGAFSRETEDSMAAMAERIGTGWRDSGYRVGPRA